MGRWIWCIGMILFLLKGYATDVVKVGLLTDYRVTSFMFTPYTGEYILWGDSRALDTLTKLDVSKVSFINGRITVSGMKGNYGEFEKVGFTYVGSFGSFKLKSASPNIPSRIYDDNLRVSPQIKGLMLTCEANIDHYVAGVVEAECGIRQGLEYYKLQAILCRTYALNNKSRHEEMEYDLCDRVHCQVYKKKSLRSDSILVAVDATRGFILVDENLKLITAAFHSNCGGYTANSEHVWLQPRSYLKSVRDPFCEHSTHATWTKSISKKSWIDFLRSTFNYPVEDTMKLRLALNYRQDQRDAFYANDSTIPLKDIRSFWGLRSAYFSTKENGDMITLNGRGFGHGVGLCQEGAMVMARSGYTHKQIIDHYFRNVNIVSLAALKFFLEDN